MATLFDCPSCGAEFETLSDEPGLVYSCPHCEHRIRLAGVARPASRPTVRPGRGVSLTRTCPDCGTRYPSREHRCPGCGVGYREAKIMAADAREAERARPYAMAKAGIGAGVLGGIVLLAIAAVWFFGGLAAGIVFPYPAVLALAGLYAIGKGLATGNLAGRARPARSRRYGRR